MRYKWKLERYGIECVVVKDGTVCADSLQEAQDKVSRVLDVYNDSWRESEIQLDERNQLCLDPPVKCWIKEYTLGKPFVLTMWRE